MRKRERIEGKIRREKIEEKEKGGREIGNWVMMGGRQGRRERMREIGEERVEGKGRENSKEKGKRKRDERERQQRHWKRS